MAREFVMVNGNGEVMKARKRSQKRAQVEKELPRSSLTPGQKEDIITVIVLSLLVSFILLLITGSLKIVMIVMLSLFVICYCLGRIVDALLQQEEDQGI